MIFIVYKTTNLINGKFYIGKHNQLTDEFDGYYGSGSLLKKAIKKYGKQHFKRETLYVYPNEEDAYLREIEILNEYLNDSLCYNIRPGGAGRNYNTTEQTRLLQSASALARWENVDEYNAMVCERQNRYKSKNGKKIINTISKSVADLWKDPEYINKQQLARQSTEYKHKLSISAKNRKLHICPHCGKAAQASNISRWHGDNCKFKQSHQ